jgi:hypothetical protein
VLDEGDAAVAAYLTGIPQEDIERVMGRDWHEG